MIKKTGDVGERGLTGNIRGSRRGIPRDLNLYLLQFKAQQQILPASECLDQRLFIVTVYQ